jgi:bacillithiol system protein YtxJ
MEFTPLTHIDQLKVVDEVSASNGGSIIFKHSTRCSISSMAFNRFSRDWKNGNHDFAVYYLDVVHNRDVSNAIAEKYGVRHESPQVLLIKNGEAVYDASHYSIRLQEIEEVTDA